MDVSVIADRVRPRYREQHRCYHDERHLDAVLARLDELLAPTERGAADGGSVGAGSVDAGSVDVVALRLAALFHDAIYVVGSATNEADSAELARAELAAVNADGALVDEVTRLVLLTADHVSAASDLNGSLLNDADLAILAASPADYAQYVADVRTEWPHLDDVRFTMGRIAVMERLLMRPFIYATEYGRSRWESRARANVGTELEVLRATASG